MASHWVYPLGPVLEEQFYFLLEHANQCRKTTLECAMCRRFAAVRILLLIPFTDKKNRLKDVCL